MCGIGHILPVKMLRFLNMTELTQYAFYIFKTFSGFMVEEKRS